MRYALFFQWRMVVIVTGCALTRRSGFSFLQFRQRDCVYSSQRHFKFNFAPLVVW